MCGRGYLLYQPEIVHEPGHTKSVHETERAVWPDGTPAPSVRIVSTREELTGLDWVVKSKFDYLNCGWEDEEVRFATREEAEALAEEWFRTRNSLPELPTKEQWYDEEFGDESWYPDWKANNLKSSS